MGDFSSGLAYLAEKRKSVTASSGRTRTPNFPDPAEMLEIVCFACGGYVLSQNPRRRIRPSSDISACAIDNRSVPVVNRRKILRTLAAVAASHALSAQAGPREVVADAAAGLPGIGEPDVFYPDFFEGEWTLSRILYSVQPTGAGDPELMQRVGTSEEFRVRFTDYRGNIVSDRGFNARQEAIAAGSRGGAVSVLWRFDNPNVLTVSTGAAGNGGELTREIKVTKRSFSVPGGRGTFIESEYARIVDVGGSNGGLLGAGGPPKISARRRMVQYRTEALDASGTPVKLAALCVEYRYPPSPPNAEPILTLKYREILTKSGFKDESGKEAVSSKQ